MENDYPVALAADPAPSDWPADGARGAPRKWPFIDMVVGSVIQVSDSSLFASARAAVMYAKKAKGLKLRTKVKSGILYVKRFQ